MGPSLSIDVVPIAEAAMSAPRVYSATSTITVEMTLNAQEAKIKKEVARVNMTEVLLLRFECPSMFLTTTV